MAYKKLIKVSNVCQLLDKRTFPATTTIAGVTFTNNGDGSWTISGKSTSAFSNRPLLSSMPLKQGHIYLSPYVRGNAYIENKFINKNNVIAWGADRYTADENSKVSVGLIALNAFDGTDTVVIPQLFDLTEMYGAGHEPTTVEQFRQDFPDEMYDYSPYCWLTSYKRVLVTGNETYPTLTAYRRNLTCKTKNLFDINSVSNIKNWVTSTTAAHPYGYYTFYLKPNTTYTFSRKYASNNDKVYAGFSKNYGVADGMFIHPTASSLVRDKVTFTTDNTGVMYLNVYGIRSVMNSFIELIEGAQLELGDTATDYVPYGYL